MSTPDRYDDPLQRYSYRSALIERLRAGNGELRAGRITVRAARTFGFCWGVDRAVAMVHDALQSCPGHRIWLLDQIIHNPHVNADLKRKGVRFLRGPFSDGAEHEIGELNAEDVVVIPAFSATVEDVEALEAAGCKIVDTTCPWVIKPHKRTLNYVKDGFTTLIHGLVRHEETRTGRDVCRRAIAAACHEHDRRQPCARAEHEQRPRGDAQLAGPELEPEQQGHCRRDGASNDGHALSAGRPGSGPRVPRRSRGRATKWRSRP